MWTVVSMADLSWLHLGRAGPAPHDDEDGDDATHETHEHGPARRSLDERAGGRPAPIAGH